MDSKHKAMGAGMMSALGGWEDAIEKKGPQYKEMHKGCPIRLASLQKEGGEEAKVVSIGQLREIMAGCLEGKKQKDDQCKASGQHLVTLEAYLFEYLQDRYHSSDPDDIKEWFHALSKAINKYGLFDSGFSTFGKMLKNMLPEGFPGMQKVLQGCAEQQLKKEVSEIEFRNRNYNPIPIAVYEKIANKLFSQKDAADIMKRVKDPLPKTGKRFQINSDALARGCVRWQYGMEILLTFNMNLQEDFLADFITEFRNLDRGHDGSLGAAQLQELVTNYGTLEHVQDGSSQHFAMLSDAKASTMRSIRKYRRLTFSEAATLFIELQQARWSINGKKGVRYQYHDKLKAHMMIVQAEQEKARKLAEQNKHKSARQKKLHQKGHGSNSQAKPAPKKTTTIKG